MYSMKYGLFGKFIAVENKRDELAEILVKASELLQENKDCIHYVIGTSSDENEVYVSEVWTSKEAHDKSLEPENIRNLIMTARPLIADMPGGTELDVIDGKGL
jgi:quinol monooxygenase YgiN